MIYPQCLFNWFLELLFPAKCIFCGLMSRKNEYVCKKCLKSIPIKKHFECIGCKKSVKLGQTCFACSKEYSLDNLFIAGEYKEEKIKKLIKLYKYRFIDKLSGPIYSLIAKYISWLSKAKKFNIFTANPLIVPVPLSGHRLNERGFNQSELLAKELSDHMQFEFKSGLLIRENSTPQADIESREERIENIKNKFGYVGQNLNGREIIILDDVCTTGSTLNECAKLLKQNGAGKIYALVIARG